jgi:hypothetical protein
MPAKLKLRAALCALGALAVVALSAPAANAADAHFEGASADGKIAFFSTIEQLVSGDTDNRTDVYVRYFDEAVGEGGAFVTRIVSLGPTGGNNAFDATFDGASVDGRLVFFSTREKLTAEDTDNLADIYVRDLEAKATSLVSGSSSGSFDANFVGMSSDGSRIFFSTKEKLTGDDTDESFDIYVNEAGSVERVSQGASGCAPACGNDGSDANFLGASADGTKVAFESSEPLTGQPDAKPRIYLRDMSKPASETTQLVSPSGTCPEGKSAEECEPSFGGISSDGSRVFFETSAQVTGDDTDKAQDVYAWSGGVVTRASTGPDGGNAEGNANARFAGSLPDGSAVFLETSEQLKPAADTDSSQDIYERNLESEETTLVSQGEPACQPAGCGNGSFNAGVVLQDNVPDGVMSGAADTRVFFFTKEKLTAEDTDSAFDVYARELPAGETVRVSRGTAGCEPGCGNGSIDAGFSSASGDGSRAFFVTDEGLDGEDLDSGAKDIYERDLDTGTTTRISRGDVSICGSPPCDNGDKDAQLHGVSTDGTVAFFVSEERLTADADVADDKVYSRSGSTTRLVSTGNPAGLQLGPPPPVLSGTDPESPGASTSPRVLGDAEVGSFVKIYETVDCSGEPVATGGAAILLSPGIGVSVEAGVTTTFRATAEADGFVSSCSEPASYKQHSEESSGGDGGGGGGGGSGGGGSISAPRSPSEKERAGLNPFQYETPHTRITFGPAFKTRIRRPVFRFTDSTGQPGTSFFCKLDHHRWHTCNSPTKVHQVGSGKHVFQVRGINAVGVEEARPSRRKFKVVRR